AGPVSLAFVFGVGRTMAPLETALEGLEVGGESAVDLDAGRPEAALGHLAADLPVLPEAAGPLRLRARVDKVAEAAPRDVVRALARVASCGCGC
ncbi:MAG: hypothetical protein JRI97_04110, partial [Deltaproteobacteria bacterium]|nr:hypothetical protein [Deltaproteobacteria bacterium]